VELINKEESEFLEQLLCMYVSEDCIDTIETSYGAFGDTEAVSLAVKIGRLTDKEDY